MGRKSKTSSRLTSIKFYNRDGTIEIFPINQRGSLEVPDVIKNLRAPRNSYQKLIQNKQDVSGDISSGFTSLSQIVNIPKRKAFKEARIDLPQSFSAIREEKCGLSLQNSGAEIMEYSGARLPFSGPDSSNISPESSNISPESSDFVSRLSSDFNDPSNFENSFNYLQTSSNSENCIESKTNEKNSQTGNCCVERKAPITERTMFYQLFNGFGFGVSVDDFLNLQNSRQRILFVEDFRPPCYVP